MRRYSHRGNGAVGHVHPHGLVAEELEQRDRHLALARPFRAEHVQYRERPQVRDDDVAEKGGEVEADAGYGVLAIDVHQLVGEVEEADVTAAVHELPLELEELVVILVERGKGGDVVVLPLVFHDAEFAECAELAVDGDAV